MTEETTWVGVPDASDFPIENLPWGIFDAGTGPRAGVAIGDHVLDLSAAHDDGLLDGLPADTFADGTLNRFAALGHETWSTTRLRVGELLTDDTAESRVGLIPRSEVRMRLPLAIGDYVDFYSSLHHATNVGKLFRPGQEPLLPNWRYLPVGYHGRASTVVVSGTDVTRPAGQRQNPEGGPPLFGPSTRLDIELEVGFITGPGNTLGEPIAAAAAEEHIFGVCLVNDWSARDIQAWEYVPLGPFLGKSFATSMSPWIVPLDALTPYRVDPPRQEPEVLPYLQIGGPSGLDLHLEIVINDTTVSHTEFKDMYWTMAQQLAHATVNGAVVHPGDLFASGTVSGPDPGTEGSLLELTRGGERPIVLSDGTDRTFLEDGDRVTIRGWCGGNGAPRIGFGVCAGAVLPNTA